MGEKKKTTGKRVMILAAVWTLGAVIVLVAVFVLALFLFVKCSAAVADFSLPARDRADYTQRAGNFDGKGFHNERDFQIMLRGASPLDDGIVSGKETVPKDPIPVVRPNFYPALDPGDFSFTWLGHSTLLLRLREMNILFDPILTRLVSPVRFTGVKRFSDPPAAADDLPKIDLLILTHDHYDHLDYQTIRALDGKVERYIVPLGVEHRLRRFGVAREKITKMAWWEEIAIGSLKIACTPARHFSGRCMLDRDKTLWCSFVLADEKRKIFVSGDTGYDAHFGRIRERYGDFDLVFTDGAQYDPRWPSVHMKPEEAFRAIGDLGAKYAVPIHWGAFRLANHPWDDSAVRLVRAAEGSAVSIITPRIGETVPFNSIKRYRQRWYEDVR